MATTQRDPQYISETLRTLRRMRKLTQENLAEAANLSSRTIEKSESGRHCPDEQTLRSVARALGFDVRVFDRPTPQEDARQKAEMNRAIRKSVLVATHPVRTAKDFLAQYGDWHAWRIDASAVESEEALEIASAMADWIKDMDGIWELCSMSERLAYARNFAELCNQIEAHGYLCHIGRHRQRLRENGKPDLIVLVGLMSVRPKQDSDGERYALVQLDGAWETLEEDRPSF
jgi:transcriptional regulator with XRE-family HTH domain